MRASDLARRPQSSAVSNRRRIVRILLMVAGWLALGSVVASCDTTARITFESRTFSEAHTSGFIAPRGQCGDFGPDNDGVARFRFVMIADDNTPILPGEVLSGGEVNMSSDSLEMSSGVLFSEPDLACGANSNPNSIVSPPTAYPNSHDAGLPDGGDAGGGMSMDTGTTEDTGTADTGNGGGGDEDAGNGNGTGGGSSDDGTYPGEILQHDGTCNGPYSCQLAKDDASGRRCQNSTQFTVENVAHVADVENDQLFGILVENSRSMDGYYPQETHRDYYDENADGEATVQVPSTPVNTLTRGEGTSIATDERGERKSVLRAIENNWRDVHELAEEQGRETRFGLWSIRGEAIPTSFVTENGGPESGWAESPGDVRDSVEALVETDVDATQGANIYESIHSVLDEHYTGSNYGEFDKTLVAIVDGPTDRRAAGQRRLEASVDQIIEKAQQSNTRIFIVHFDPSLNLRNSDTDEKLLFDDPSYWEVECSDDSECKNFEVCRQVHGYSENSPDEVTIGGGDQKYCVPQRREDGRLGPIADYGRIGCESRGGYIYLKSTGDLSEGAEWLPYTLDGLWEAEVTVEEALRPESVSGDSVQIQSTVNVQAGDSTETLDLSQVGGNPVDDEPGSGDRRSVLFNTGDSGGGDGDE